jgi:microcompartment protein CcmL/EutN
MTCNTYDAPSSKASTRALTTEQLRSQLYSFSDLIALERNPALRYPVQDLSDAIASTILAFNTVIDKTEYPLITDRLAQGEIGVSEYADFLSSSGYTPTQVTTIFTGVAVATVPMSSYFDQLEFYYNDNMAKSISGGFCAAFTGALAALNQLVSAGVALISQLKNAVASVIAQLNSIKELLFNIVDQLKDMMMQQIQNVMQQITQIKTRILSVMTFFNEKVRKAKEFFSDLNMQNLKTKIEEIIAKMAGNFEEITPEVLAYLLFRLCQLSEIISNFMQSPVDTLKGLLSNFAVQELAMSNISNMARARSVSAGGFRMDPFEVIKTREQLANNVNSSNTPGVAPKSYVTVPFTEQEWQMVSTLTTSGNQYVEFGSQVINQNDPVVGAGVTKIRPEVLIILFRIAKRMGNKRFLINSGYRSPTQNKNLESSGAAKNSYHMSGMALDVDMTRFGNTDQFRNTFIEYASQEGIGGIGTYNSFIHIDIGPRRIWGSRNIDALTLHRNDKFRSGGASPTKPATEVVPVSDTSTRLPVDPRLSVSVQNQTSAQTGGSTSIVNTGGIVADITNPIGA